VTRQGKFRFEEYFDKRIDPSDRVYYWLTGKQRTNGDAVGSDSFAVANNKISITPIHYDMTHEAVITKIETMIEAMRGLGVIPAKAGIQTKTVVDK